jgi:glycosyltransferase involved in cell wall biosynthesis
MMVADLVDRTKNVSGVIRAIGMVRDQGTTLYLDVIGDGPDRGMLEELVRGLGLTDRITFHGRLPNREVLARMGSTGAVVINSNVETFSVVTGEALALGKPVVATRCGGPVAFINPDNGMLVPVGDERAVATALLQVHDRFPQYSPARIRDGVGKSFSASAVGRTLLALYTRVLAHG